MSECVGRRNATAGRTPTQNALVQSSVYTATPDKTRLPRLPDDRACHDTDSTVVSCGRCELGITLALTFDF